MALRKHLRTEVNQWTVNSENSNLCIFQDSEIYNWFSLHIYQGLSNQVSVKSTKAVEYHSNIGRCFTNQVAAEMCWISIFWTEMTVYRYLSFSSSKDSPQMYQCVASRCSFVSSSVNFIGISSFSIVLISSCSSRKHSISCILPSIYFHRLCVFWILTANYLIAKNAYLKEFFS